MAIQKLHHAAFRCRNSEQTRRFYEDFLGMPLVGAVEIGKSKTGRAVEVLHTFYRMADGSALAFFEEPGTPFEFKAQRDFDLHVALEVELADLVALLAKAKALGIEARGVSNHGSIHSVYFRDPNGYVIELAARIRPPIYDEPPRDILTRWTQARA